MESLQWQDLIRALGGNELWTVNARETSSMLISFLCSVGLFFADAMSTQHLLFISCQRIAMKRTVKTLRLHRHQKEEMFQTKMTSLRQSTNKQLNISSKLAFPKQELERLFFLTSCVSCFCPLHDFQQYYLSLYENCCHFAYANSRRNNVESAINWILMHTDDPNVDTPVSAAELRRLARIERQFQPNSEVFLVEKFDMVVAARPLFGLWLDVQ